MAGPITAYRRERAEIEAAWQAECLQNGWPGEFESPVFKAYWDAQIQYDQRLHQLDARHFKMPEKARYATSRLELWAYITKVSLVVLWVFRSTNRSTSRYQDPALVDALSALHSLQIPWADAPPYPDLTFHEVEDKLRSIANRLEKDDLEAEDEADKSKKTIENIADPKVREYVKELQKLMKEHGKIPWGKKREIARRLCKKNIRAANSLERSGREWKHLIDRSE